MALDPELSAALEPVLRDLASTSVLTLVVRDSDWSFPDDVVTAFVDRGGGLGAGVAMQPQAPLADRVVELADQVQEIAVEAMWAEGLSATWPECPRHPNSHPLAAEVDADRAVWRCPRDRVVVGEIGGLEAPRESRRRRARRRR